jgi:hypothetical protein
LEKIMKPILFVIALTFASVVQARITDAGAPKVEPFADGAQFGAVGAYERVSGVAKGELDPVDIRNRVIVNLSRAPKNARGMVEYEVDWFMLRPADASKGNGKILYDVTNRGRKFLHHWLMDGAAGNDPKSPQDAGSALFLRLGYTIVWSGWDPDAPKAGNGMAMKSPVVPNVVRVIRDELVSATRGPVLQSFRLSYEAASTDKHQAMLTTRRKEKDAREMIPPEGWEYVNSREIRLLPPHKLAVGSLYEFHYPARDPKVLGIGFAAVRDLISHLRDKSNAKSALAVGISQSGRYLRDFVHQGFNQDESARKVFDGVLSHIAGIGGVFLNAEFAQPARTNTQHEDHTYPENAFPFSAARQTDPVSGRVGALLREDGFDPLWMDVNTSTEYWQKGASLLHTDPLGRADVALPANARVYLVAGTQHGGRTGLKADFGPCMNPRNPHSPAPALRALLVALDAWVSDGTLPPPSRVPSLGAKTLTQPAKTGFPALPDTAVATIYNEIALYGDWINPKELPSPYRPMVSAVDTDGNELAGIRLPDIAVPLGTYTGWNLYKRPFTESELCDRDGSFISFARTEAERTAKKDPRPSLEKRYGSNAKYVAKVSESANLLVGERLLLQEDADAYVKAAQARRW